MDYKKLTTEDTIKTIPELIFGNFTDGILPVDMEKLYQRMGITVTLADRDSILDSTTVEINRNHSARRKRYAMAHMLGHITLHHPLPIIEDASAYMANNPSFEEWQANVFALSLLIPEKTFDMYVRKLGYEDISKIAEICGVGEVAIRAKFTIDGNI
ncbi:ImmA/IrrE family metallopeptidase [Ochrobactrum phage vB_OspM_OC]|nr:ImmA/IrrE family metallopeptidase [Ochrobactrum phage vB_OspM_OC]